MIQARHHSQKRPEQLKLDFALWTRAAVMLLIERECGIRLPVRSVGEYLKRWAFTPQKPICRAYEKSPVAVQKWLDESYPEIAKRAKTEGAEIHWRLQPQWSTRMFVAAAMRPKEILRWLLLSAARGRSYR